MRYVLLVLLCCSAAYGAVDVHDGKVSANLNGESLDSVIESIRQQTQIRFSVQEGMGDQSISANFENLPVAVAVKKMLEGTGINFVVLGDNEGQPESIFIGTSEKPGSAPRKMDNRPTQNRGVVTPVAPMPPQPPPIPQPEATRPEPGKQPPPTVNVPTGGGFVPQSDKEKDQDSPEQQQVVPERPPEEQQQEEQ